MSLVGNGNSEHVLAEAMYCGTGFRFVGTNVVLLRVEQVKGSSIDKIH